MANPLQVLENDLASDIHHITIDGNVVQSLYLPDVIGVTHVYRQSLPTSRMGSLRSSDADSRYEFIVYIRRRDGGFVLSTRDGQSSTDLEEGRQQLIRHWDLVMRRLRVS